MLKPYLLHSSLIPSFILINIMFNVCGFEATIRRIKFNILIFRILF